MMLHLHISAKIGIIAIIFWPMNRFFLLLILLPINAVAQFNESFTDDEIFNNPTWQGATDRFIVNSDQMLQLKAPAEKGDAFLFTPCKVVEAAQWQVKLRMDFNPSSSNLCRIYLIADAPQVSQLVNCVYVEVGSTADDVCLYKMEDGQPQKLIDGLDGRVALSVVELQVRVRRKGNVWSLEVNGSDEWITEGEVEALLPFTSDYFGLYCKYTSTRCDKFFFDDIFVSGEAYVDRDQPLVSDFSLVNGSQLQVRFNEKVEHERVQASQFHLIQHNRFPSEIILKEDSMTVHLHFIPGLEDVENEAIQISGISDLAGNVMGDTSFIFSYERIRVDQLQLTNDSTLSVAFNKAISLNAWDEASVRIQPGIYSHQVVGSFDSERLRYDLQLNKPLAEAVNHVVTIGLIRDERGDTIRSVSDTVWVFHPKRFDVVISEIMADPAPSMGLPESEFLELVNRTDYALTFSGWTLQVNEKQSVLADFTMEAHAHLALVPKTDESDWALHSHVWGMEKWPTLTNESSTVVLRDERGWVIDALDYHRDQVPGEPFKREGGWSAERMDVNHLSATVNNWAWSADLSGGTPGRENSKAAILFDDMAPAIEYVTLEADSILGVYFSEAMDLTIEKSSFEFSAELPDWHVTQIDTIFLRYLKVQFAENLKPGYIYQLKKCQLYDLATHPVQQEDPLRFGVCAEVTSGDVIINEVLFNPRPDEEDFVELYNRSTKVINIADLAFAKGDENQQLSQLFPFSDQNRMLFPGDYLVLTPDSLLLMAAYQCESPKSILALMRFPSLPDDEGEVLLTDRSGALIDHFAYREQMHFDLLKDKEGVSLERLSPDGASDDPRNWHSAASAVGYATPTGLNSQALTVTNKEENVWIAPEVFSPNGDGRDDLLTIGLKNVEPDGMVSIRIYNGSGQEVTFLVNNELMAAQSVYTWDGLGMDREQLMPGIYIIWVRCFYPSGKVVEQKRSCVLSGGRL